MHERRVSLAPSLTRAVLLRTGLRSVGAVVALFLIYAVLPLDKDLSGNGVLLLLGGMAALVVIVTFQVRAILHHERPALRAIEAVSVTIPFFLLMFASVYVVMSHQSSGWFAYPLSRVNAFYFTVTVFATVGFGDIAPLSNAARMVVTLQNDR